MKFLIHIPQLIYGGAEKVLVDFSNYLVEKGHEVQIIETYERGLLKSEFNSKVVFDSICSKEYTNKFYVSLDDILKEKNMIKKIQKAFKKIFITIAGYERLATILAKKRYKGKEFDAAINYLEIQSPNFIIKCISASKYLQWIHTDISKTNGIEFADKQMNLYKELDNIICVSKTSKKSFDDMYAELKDKTKVIYNFYNSEKIKSMSKGDKVFYDDEFNILSVGRLVEAKGYERAIDVFHKLKQEGYDFRWSIIGEGILREKLEEKIKSLGLKNNIKLLGIKENPYPYIKQCDLFFLPSLYEGFPTVTIEAKILEKTVLATEVSGIKEQIISKRNGLIVKNDNEHIYKELKDILDDINILNILKTNNGIEAIIDNREKYKQIINLVKS